MVCPPRAAVLGSRTRVDAYNRSITTPLTGEPDAGDPPVRFGGRGKVQSLVPTPIGGAGKVRRSQAPGIISARRQTIGVATSPRLDREPVLHNAIERLKYRSEERRVGKECRSRVSP